MKKNMILKMSSAILALLFFYAAISKLVDYETSRQEMLNQVFSRSIALVLVWLVPFIELTIVGLLLLNSQRLKGFYTAFALLTLFSLYITITMSGAFGRIPCSCGGILKNMGYWTHFIFNLFFIALSVLGIALESQWTIDRFTDFFKRKEVTHI